MRPVVEFPLARPHTRLACHNPNWPVTPTRVAWSHPLAPKLWRKSRVERYADCTMQRRSPDIVVDQLKGKEKE
jgi:hypothetical protein